MIDINTAVKITERKQKKYKKDTTEKDYQRFLKYLSKKIIKECKKGNFDYCFDATCERKILDRLKIDLNNIEFTNPTASREECGNILLQ